MPEHPVHAVTLIAEAVAKISSLKTLRFLCDDGIPVNESQRGSKVKKIAPERKCATLDAMVDSPRLAG
jgi:hypothetical protein